MEDRVRTFHEATRMLERKSNWKGCARCSLGGDIGLVSSVEQLWAPDFIGPGDRWGGPLEGTEKTGALTLEQIFVAMVE